MRKEGPPYDNVSKTESLHELRVGTRFTMDGKDMVIARAAGNGNRVGVIAREDWTREIAANVALTKGIDSVGFDAVADPDLLELAYTKGAGSSIAVADLSRATFAADGSGEKGEGKTKEGRKVDMDKLLDAVGLRYDVSSDVLGKFERLKGDAEMLPSEKTRGMLDEYVRETILPIFSGALPEEVYREPAKSEVRTQPAPLKISPDAPQEGTVPKNGQEKQVVPKRRRRGTGKGAADSSAANEAAVPEQPVRTENAGTYIHGESFETKPFFLGMHSDPEEVAPSAAAGTVSPEAPFKAERTAPYTADDIHEDTDELQHVVLRAPRSNTFETAESVPASSPDTGNEEAYTPRESREQLRSAARRFGDIVKRTNESERGEMLSKENAYLQAYKDLEQKKTIWARLSKGKELREEQEQVDRLKSEYNDSRKAYEEAINAERLSSAFIGQEIPDSYRAKMTARYQELVDSGQVMRDADGTPIALESFIQSEFLKRQERLSAYVQFREVRRPLAEKKRQARLEALDERGRNAFSKGLAWYADKNRRLEEQYGKTASRAIRAAMSTILIVGGSAAIGGFGTAGALAIVGYGTFRFGKALLGSTIGATGGAAAGMAYEKLLGRGAQKKAKRDLLHSGLGDKEDYDTIDAQREKLAKNADEATLQKKKAIIQILAAVGIGGLSSAWLTEQVSVQRALDQVDADGAPRRMIPIGLINEGVRPGTGTGAGEITPSGSLTQPETILKGAVLGKGDGFNQLVVDLRNSVRTDFPGMTESSPVMKELFSMSPTELSDKFGAFDPETGKSMLMQRGDQLMLDEKGNLWFQKLGEKPQLLMEPDPANPGKVITHEIKGVEMREPAMPAREQSESPRNAETSGARAGDDSEPERTEATDADTISEETSRTDDPPARNQARGLDAAPGETAAAASEEPVQSRPQTPSVQNEPPKTASVVENGAGDQSSAVPREEALARARPFETASGPIDALFKSPLWERFRNGPETLAMFREPTLQGTPEDAFRSQMFEVLRDSGVGPNPGEPLEPYLKRANAAIDLARTTGEPIIRPGVFRVDGALYVHGGDLQSREILASEYVRLNGGQVFVENPGSSAPLLVYPPEATGVTTDSGAPIMRRVPAPESVRVPRAGDYGSSVF